MAENHQQQLEEIQNATQSSSLLDEIMAQTRIASDSEGYDIAKQGVAAFISNILETGSNEEPVNKLLIDRMINEIDRKLSAQVDEILHNPEFRNLESSWRSLKLLVDKTDFRENIKINVIHVTKSELLDDFEFAPEIVQSGFYKHVYSSGYGQFGGEPVGAVIGNYEFTPKAPVYPTTKTKKNKDIGIWRNFTDVSGSKVLKNRALQCIALFY
ncbi:type VI secretion system contractile sheath domain-containing protein [Ursidibacter sp. B-7004-1]